MSKKALREKSGVSTASIAKLDRGGNVTTNILIKISIALNCDITEIMMIE